ncbi:MULTISPECIES: nuclear transport factor 2 family protein [unclassified Achromobacter]|uniref:nuclear transport factor 2 family protein n=1 Tax=unclassified Achromobacter TaxID=2626865 RepID=UPI001E44CF9E|nr:MULTISPECIES: nuclear transport factor 2 family protein [unclassified Achromobacter]
MKKRMIYGARLTPATGAPTGRKLVDAFIQATNAFDVDGALALFTSDAVIDDVSVGDAFVGTEGIRLYLTQFFVGYKTVSQLLSIEQTDDRHIVVRLDFTGDFGHETGRLKIAVDGDGLIKRIDADLD